MDDFCENLLLNRNYLLDLCVRMAHHSTAIEGNTLTQNETATIILNNYIPRAVSEREYFEVKNYRNILPFFVDSLKNKEKLNNELIKEFHKILMDNLMYNNGKFKSTPNLIIGADFEPTKPYLVPLELKDLIDNLYYQFSCAKNKDEKIRIILQTHIKFEKIHPFSDGNGRVGRLLIVYSCLEQNIIPIVIPSDKKDEYISFLKTQNLDEFCKFTKSMQDKEKEKIQIFQNME